MCPSEETESPMIPLRRSIDALLITKIFANAQFSQRDTHGAENEGLLCGWRRRLCAHSLFFLLLSGGRSLLRVREQDTSLIAKDNVALVHIYRAKSCYASLRASEAPGATYNGDIGIASC